MGASRSREAASFCSTDDAIPLLESSGPRTPTTTAAGGACSLQVSAFAAASEVGSLSPFFFFFFARGERKRGIFYYFLGGREREFFVLFWILGFIDVGPGRGRSEVFFLHWGGGGGNQI
jgi:hypothetical protein